jgi:UDP-N-acetylmuramate--alanine ligase
MQFKPGQRIHLVGIGGFGLSAIARILLEQGFVVSGSDRNPNALTATLARDGAHIYSGHAAEFVSGADVVIASSAVTEDHVEVRAARERGLPVYKRKDIIAALMTGKRVIAVAGTHGKTTTTAMIAHILRECGRDPSYIVGGVMANTGTNAAVGQGDDFVIEADEYDHMFHGLRPDVILLTGVEYDHPDFFRSEVELVTAFEDFLALLPVEGGLLVACADNDCACDLAGKWRNGGGTVYTYGLEAGAYFRAENLRVEEEVTVFDVVGAEGRLSPVRLALAGAHNVQNALGALLVASQSGVPLADAAAALASFASTGRRFELRGEVNGVAVIDDYAHHPTAIKATLAAARMRYPGRALWAVWQPHMYSRTRQLLDQYMTAFADADHVLVTEIYAAREQPIPGVDGETVSRSIRHADARHAPTLEAAAKLLAERVTPPAVVLIMGAGDAPRIGELLLESMRDGVGYAHNSAQDPPR